VRSLCIVAYLAFAVMWPSIVVGKPLRIASFEADATPPLGSPCAYRPAERILDPLRCRGLVLLGDGLPIVLCAIDWIGIGNEGHEAWRSALAEAAGTVPERVAVHALHQHDAPRCDFTVARLLAAQGIGDQYMDTGFARRTIQKVASKVQAAMANAESVTHLGLGQAKVEKVASNRRILGPDGKVKYVRFSACRVPEAVAAPEGTIDPYVKTIAFFQDQRPLAVLTYYATHPQSYYRQGDVSADFVGLARDRRDAALPSVMNIHFNGAGGNIAAGKYNDGSKENRPVLADRLAAGLAHSFDAIERVPITAADVEWQVQPVRLPPRETLDRDSLMAEVSDSSLPKNRRVRAADKLAFLLYAENHPCELACLRLGSAYILHMPGELFVEYQLAAQRMRPDAFVAMAAYGDYGAGYIGTEISYGQGGYETGPDASLTDKSVESVLMHAMEELLSVASPTSDGADADVTVHEGDLIFRGESKGQAHVRRSRFLGEQRISAEQ